MKLFFEHEDTGHSEWADALILGLSTAASLLALIFLRFTHKGLDREKLKRRSAAYSFRIVGGVLCALTPLFLNDPVIVAGALLAVMIVLWGLDTYGLVRHELLHGELAEAKLERQKIVQTRLKLYEKEASSHH